MPMISERILRLEITGKVKRSTHTIMETKDYNIYDYQTQCPLARSVEDAVNTCSSPSSHLEKLEALFGYDDRMYCFFCACIQYWAKAKYYDDRNIFAVLVSKEIIKEFPNIPHLKGTTLSEELQKEAYAFTLFAHRYLQNSLFKVIIDYYFKKTGYHGIYDWYFKQEFVIDRNMEKVVPWKEYQKTYR